MFDIIATDYHFNERLVARCSCVSAEEASQVAREYYNRHQGQLIRVFWRTVREHNQ